MQVRNAENVRVCLKKLIRELDEAGRAIHAIRHLSNDYALPSDACNTFLSPKAALYQEAATRAG